MMARTPAGELTTLGLAVLALLTERAMHPYELYQLLVARREDCLVKVRPGTLYHAVSRLAERGAVRATGTDRAGNRPERTVYEITDCGRTALRLRCAELLSAPVREYPTFPVALAEAHNLPKDEVVDVLRQRIALLDAEIAELDEITGWATANNLARRFWLAPEYNRAVRVTERDWLSQLVADLSSGELKWGDRDCATDWTSPAVYPRQRKIEHEPSAFTSDN